MQNLTDYFPKHPIPMEATFRECFLVNFAIDPPAVGKLLPKPITPALYGGKAFLSIVIARLYRMRPSFIPAPFGITFNQVVYRIVAECRNERGVYFLRSDADSRLMALGGELLTNFHFHASRISFTSDKNAARLSVKTSPNGEADISGHFDIKNAGYVLPARSRFPDLDEAKRFLVELYQAFSVSSYTLSPMTVKIRRGEWDIKVVNDLRGHYQLMENSRFFNRKNSEMDSVFYINNVDYHWGTRNKLK